MTRRTRGATRHPGAHRRAPGGAPGTDPSRSADLLAYYWRTISWQAIPCGVLVSRKTGVNEGLVVAHLLDPVAAVGFIHETEHLAPVDQHAVLTTCRTRCEHGHILVEATTPGVVTTVPRQPVPHDVPARGPVSTWIQPVYLDVDGAAVRGTGGYQILAAGQPPPVPDPDDRAAWPLAFLLAVEGAIQYFPAWNAWATERHIDVETLRAYLHPTGSRGA